MATRKRKKSGERDPLCDQPAGEFETRGSLGARFLVSTGERVCNVCWRRLPVRKKGTRGRPRTRHKECTIIKSRMDEVAGMLVQLRFLPPGTKPGSNALLGAALEMKRDLIEMTRILTTLTIQCATDRRDYYDPGAKGHALRGRAIKTERKAKADAKVKRAAAKAKK